MAKPIYSLAQIKAQLDSGGGWVGQTISYAMPDSLANSGGPSAGFQPLSAAMQADAALAFELWDDLIAPSLNEVASAAQITFAYSSTTNGSTYTSYSFSPATPRDRLTDANIWFDQSWTSHDQDSDITAGSYGFLTYLHEIGHALGLDHPGEYAGNVSYSATALYAQDTRRYTVMSYFDAGDSGDGTNHKGSYGATPLVHDIAAIQAIYGADQTTRTGNTVYGFGANAGRDAFDFTVNTAPVVAIWDAGGRDTLNLSGYAMAQTIDLRQGATSSVGGLTNNLAIAFGAVIENAIGGSGNDSLSGNAFANTLRGGAGADTLNGLGGADHLRGGAGNDILNGGGGRDTAYLLRNKADYTIRENSDGSSTVSGGGEGTDQLTNIERLMFADGALLL